jgi:hypothetical protein
LAMMVEKHVLTIGVLIIYFSRVSTINGNFFYPLWFLMIS